MNIPRLLVLSMVLLLTVACDKGKHDIRDNASAEKVYSAIRVGVDYSSVTNYLSSSIYTVSNDDGSVTYNHLWAKGLLFPGTIGVVITVRDGKIESANRILAGR